MKHISTLIGGACALLASLAIVGPCSQAQGAELPAYFKEIVGTSAPSPADIGTKNVLQLNTTMFELYGDAAQVFKKNILSQHPLILGLFSGAGGRFILYRPGIAPLDAPPVPIVYQLLKSVGHSVHGVEPKWSCPIWTVPTNLTWRGRWLAYRSQMQTALDSLDATAMQADWRPTNRSILQNNIAFMDACLKKGAISTDAICRNFAKKQSPLLKKNIAWAAQTQVAHWMDVIAELEEDARQRLGQDLRGQQHDLRRPPEQRPFQCAGAVFRPRCHQQQTDADRDDLLHDHAGRHAGVADPNHRRSLGRARVLRQLQSDGL